MHVHAIDKTIFVLRVLNFTEPRYEPRIKKLGGCKTHRNENTVGFQKVPKTTACRSPISIVAMGPGSPIST